MSPVENVVSCAVLPRSRKPCETEFMAVHHLEYPPYCLEDRVQVEAKPGPLPPHKKKKIKWFKRTLETRSRYTSHVILFHCHKGRLKS